MRLLAVILLLSPSLVEAQAEPAQLRAEAIALEQVGHYEDAAAAYEQLVRLYPAAPCDEGPCAGAREVLERAIWLRLGLGQIDEAGENVRMFERYYAATDRERARELSLGLAAALADAERWADVIAQCEQFLRIYGDDAPDLTLRAHVLAARAHRRRGELRAAIPHLEAATSRGPSVVAAIEHNDGTMRRARAIEALDEASFLAVEDRFLGFLTIEAPAIRGDVERWRDERYIPWHQRMIRIALEIERTFQTIVQHDVPAWIVAAAERAGAMYAHLADEAVRVRGDREEVVLTELGAMLREVALDRYVFCATYADRLCWPSEAAARCREALTRLDNARFPAGPFELIGSNLIGDVDTPLPLAIDPAR
jgi:tetratricopeptide (TPR) repeat protein